MSAASQRMAAARARDAARNGGGDIESSFELLTPVPLIERIRGERDQLLREKQIANGYSGPDPNPERTSRYEARIDALSDVLNWIVEFERGEAISAVNEATAWIARK